MNTFLPAGMTSAANLGSWNTRNETITGATGCGVRNRYDQITRQQDRHWQYPQRRGNSDGATVLHVFLAIETLPTAPEAEFQV